MPPPSSSHASTSSSANGAALQSISIPRTELRSDPSPSHVVYAILVRLPVRNWTVYRRYSEFLTLHQTLCADSGRGPPPAPFPPKHIARNTIRTVKGLGGLLGSWSGAADNSDDATLRERQESLERYMRAIVASPEAAWRETEAFREFIELPKTQSSKVLVTSNNIQGSSGADASSSSSSRTGRNGTGPAYRDTLPGSYHGGPNTTRHLGSSASQRPPATETAETRGQSDAQLFASQQSAFDRQDAALGDLTAILRRQRQMGMAINQELLEQNELLDGLDGEVRETQDKLGRNEKQIRRL